MTWPHSTTGVKPGMTERPIAPKEATPAGRPAREPSVDKHQDLTRRTHHQDPCGRQGPFPRNVLVQVMVEGRPSQDQAFPSYNPLPSMPRLAAAYTPKRLPVQFPGIKRQLGETYLERRLEETHLEHECRRETPRQADPSQYLNKLTRVRLSSPASQVHSGPLPSPSEPHLISPPKSGPRQAATPNRKSVLKSKEAEGCTIDPFHRRNQRHDQSVSEREMPRTGKSKPLIHALQLAHALQRVRELQAKKHAADDKEWRSSISELEG